MIVRIITGALANRLEFRVEKRLAPFKFALSV
jgi:hypothetical protein